MSLQVYLPLSHHLSNLGASGLTFSVGGSLSRRSENPTGSGSYYCPSSTTGGYLISNTTINLGNTQSMFCWMKFDDLYSDSELGGACVSQHRYPNYTGMGITIKYVNSTSGYASINTGTGSSRTYNTYCGSTLLKAGIWYHIGYTYDGSTAKIYVNGKLDGTHSVGSLSNPADYLTVFAWSFDASSGTGIYGHYHLHGNICEVKVYNHCLSASEVLGAMSPLNDGIAIPVTPNTSSAYTRNSGAAYSTYGYTTESSSGTHVNIVASNGCQSWGGVNTFNGTNGILPSGYTQLEYIHGDGNPYLDTGCSIGSGVADICVVCKPDNLSHVGCIVGAGTADSAGNGWGFYVYSSQYGVLSPGISWHNYGTSTLECATFNATISNTVTTITGPTSSSSTIATDSYWGTGQAWRSTNFLLFKGSYPSTNRFVGNIYYASIKINGALVKKLIPAKNSSGTIGMFDLVSKTFITGSGTFTAGPSGSIFGVDDEGFLLKGAGFSVSGPTSSIQAGMGVGGAVVANIAYNAVWNDLADCIEVPVDTDLEYGYCYCFDGKTYHKSNKYLEDGIIGIHSDTAGLFVGDKGVPNQLKTASAGFVLAYVDNDYPCGTPLTVGSGGILTKLLEEDIENNPHKIVGTFWKNEPEAYWGFEDAKTINLLVKVNGRKWIKVR